MKKLDEGQTVVLSCWEHLDNDMQPPAHCWTGTVTERMGNDYFYVKRDWDSKVLLLPAQSLTPYRQKKGAVTCRKRTPHRTSTTRSNSK